MIELNCIGIEKQSENKYCEMNVLRYEGNNMLHSLYVIICYIYMGSAFQTKNNKVYKHVHTNSTPSL